MLRKRSWLASIMTFYFYFFPLAIGDVAIAISGAG